MPGRKLGPWSEFPFLYRFTVLLNSGGSNSSWSEVWSEFPHFMGMGVVPAPSINVRECSYLGTGFKKSSPNPNLHCFVVCAHGCAYELDAKAKYDHRGNVLCPSLFFFGCLFLPSKRGTSFDIWAVFQHGSPRVQRVWSGKDRNFLVIEELLENTTINKERKDRIHVW